VFLRKEEGRSFTRNHVKRLAMLIAAGVCVFIALLAALQVALSLVGLRPDAMFYDFYPIMAALGAVFGFERWWGQELGEYNPFHDT
jgi:uncharacterized RDD family membrane protein YckC